jgi:MerR family transcriptional regulator, heat shock protein HspR
MAMAERNYLLVQLLDTPVVTAYLTIGELAYCCDVHPELVSRLVTLGLLDPVGRSVDGEVLFNAGAVPLLRKILRLRHDLGVNFAGIGVVLELMERMEKMEERIRELEALLFP